MADDHARLNDTLVEIVGAGFVTQAPRDLAAAGIAKAGPTWLVRPASAAEVASLVRAAGAHGALVLPFGTGSRRPQTVVSLTRPRLVMDMKRLAHVLHLDETSLIVQVQAGLTGLALEELLLPRGLTLGDFPPAALRSTLGGMLSVRTPGKSSARHGFLEDAVLGLSAVLADGRSIHTRVAPRRATGPDLARALLGSEGSLGIITGAVLRIHRRPEARLLDTHRLPSLAAAIDAATAPFRLDARPAALRIYDAAEARAHLPVLGELADDAAILCVATAGPPELAAVDRQLFADAARAQGGTSLGPTLAETWWRRRFGHSVPGPTPPAPALEIAAVPTRLAPVARAVAAAAAAAGRQARLHISRFALDGACVFVTLLDDGKPDPVGPARELVERAALHAGGHLNGMRDEALDPYRAALLRELDPTGIFGGQA